MTPVTRLVSFSDVEHRTSRPEVVDIRVIHHLELADGRKVMLLSDRGWGCSGTWADVTLEEVQRNARSVVGPDEPPEGRSREEEANLHWAYLQRIAQRQGVDITADELRRLPHDVEIGERLLARIKF